MHALELSDVHKSFGGQAALRGVDLQIAEGRILCLLGASGSGKTTLLRLVAGLERIDRGCIRIAGDTVDAASGRAVPAERRGLGMVFQDYALWPHLSALDNVALALRERGQRDAAAQAQDMLRRVGLDGLQQRRPHQLSGGQQQRVALARALAVRPRLLLCDEPLSNLDSGLREELRELIGAVVREHGLSALYITHDHREAFALGDQVGILDSGVLLQLDTPRGLLAAPCSERVARFLHALGPWDARIEGAVCHAPWGAWERPPGSVAVAGARASVYLPATAVELAGAARRPGGATVEARVLRCLQTPQGVEVHAQLHGVTVPLRSADWHAPDSRVTLHLDTQQALIYPRTAQPGDVGDSTTRTEE